jgi:DnaJ-domain-containing protein 1
MNETVFYQIFYGSMHFLMQLRRPAYYMLEEEGYEDEESFPWGAIIVALTLVLGFVYFFVRILWALLADQLGMGPFSKYYKNKPEHKQLAYAILGSHMVMAEAVNRREQYRFLLSYLRRLFSEIKPFDGVELQGLHTVYTDPKKVVDWCAVVLDVDQRIQLLDYLIDLGFHNGILNKQEMGFVYFVGRHLHITDGEVRSMLNIRFSYHQRVHEEKQNRRQSTDRERPNRKSSALKVLGLPVNTADFDTVRKAYRSLARKHHPDRYNKTSAEEQKMAHERFTEINLAYEHLKTIMDK